MAEKIVTLLNYKCRAIVNQNEGLPVVLLHGYSYSSDVWQRISITQLLSEKHIPFLSLDMPYGAKSECTPKTRSPETNLKVLHEAIQTVFNTAPVLVGASLGGHIALKYAAHFAVKGLLLVSPTRAFEQELLQAYDKFRFPVTIIWGSEDTIVSGEMLRTLTGMLPRAKMVTYQGAAHSAYISQPDRFKQDLLQLYADAEQR